MIFCSNCNGEIIEKTKFCTNCGSELIEIKSPKIEIEEELSVDEINKQSNKQFKGVIVIFSIVVAFALGPYFYFSYSDPNATKSNPAYACECKELLTKAKGKSYSSLDRKTKKCYDVWGGVDVNTALRYASLKC